MSRRVATVVVLSAALASSALVAALARDEDERLPWRFQALHEPLSNASAVPFPREALLSEREALEQRIHALQEVLALAPVADPVEEAGAPAVSSCDRRISLYLSSFLTAEPDIVGWNLFLGELASVAELDIASLQADPDGRPMGEFALPGSAARIGFEAGRTGNRLVLEGESLPDGSRKCPFRAEMGWRLEDGEINSVYGMVQFFPGGEPFDEKGLSGYTYDTEDGKTSYRPMQTILNEGQAELRVPPRSTALTVADGSMQPAFTWRRKLERSEVDASRDATR